MSYQIPGQPNPDTHSRLPENSHNQEAHLAKEKVRKIIEGQHADLKRKFDQIRQSLSEKEEKVNQELDEILNTRLNELDMCARNINVLSETYNLNQQKLGTNTLGNVNFKILATVTASIEEFRSKIGTELNIRILWGSHDIEQSIQNICTLSYMSESQDTVPKQSANQSSNLMHYQFTDAEPLTFQRIDNQIRVTPPQTLKEPFSVQPVQPTVFLPVEGPILPRTTHNARLERDNSLEHNSLHLCTLCNQYFSSTRELESHQRDNHMSPRRNSIHRENLLEIQQQQSCAAFSPVRGKISPPQSSQYTESPTQPPLLNQQVAQNYDTATPHHTPPQGNHYIPQTQLQTTLQASQHYIPQDQALQNSHQYPPNQYQAPIRTPLYPPVTQTPLYPPVTQTLRYHTPAHEAPVYEASHELELPNPHFHYPSNPTQQHLSPSPALPSPRNVTEPLQLPPPLHLPVQSKLRSSSRAFSQIGSYCVRLIWYKQVETIVERVHYFDNYNGCCDLLWDRRNEYYTCVVNLEEGEHFGQLSLSDSEIMYAVEKFALPLIQSTDTELTILILKIIQSK